MKKILFLLLPFYLHAQLYTAKIEPFNIITIYAQTSGQIVNLDKNDELKIVNKTLISLDTSLDKKILNIYENQLSLQKQKLKIKTQNYESFLKITGKSKVDKDEKFIELLEIKNAINNLLINMENLKDNIAKKQIKVKNLYIKALHVNKYDYVTQGSKLATAYDLNQALLTIYVNKTDYENLQNKQILINKKPSYAKFYKIDRTLDTTYISAYKVQILIESKNFGQSVDVEFVK